MVIPFTTRGELNEFEQLGVEKAIEWSRRRKFNVDQILSEEFVKDLHRVMFEEIWKWAGEFRRTNKNLGVDKNEIRIEIRKLLDDSKYWVASNVFDPDEIAVRFGHRIVSIHPFSNVNGRHSRLIAQGVARSAYLKALRDADGNDYRALIEFASK